MGLIKEGDDYVVLSDIAGVEDHLGDMDFKVAGTPDGITALQMDIKISGVTFEILQHGARAGPRGPAVHPRTRCRRRISETRAELSPYAPRITSIQIDPEKIGKVIGKGGETIRALSEEYEAQIDVDDDGMVLVYAVNGEKGDACVEAIRQMTKDVELGEIFTGKVVKTTTFGAFVELAKGTDGLLHISNLMPGGRAETVEDVVNKGDEVTVRVVELDKERGRIGLRLADDPEIEGQVGRGAVDDRHRATAGGRAAEAAVTVTATAAGVEVAVDATVTATAAAPAAGTRAVDPMLEEHTLTELDSGIRVVTERVPSVRSVALGLWVRVGSRDEPYEQAGISHFLEHMLFKGTKELTAEQIAQEFDGFGAEVNAATSKEATVLHAHFLDEHLESAFQVMSDMLLRSTYVGSRVRARGGARGDRDVRGRATGQGPRRALDRRVRRPSARPARDRPGRGDRRR